jgi:type IV pilus assembly protein PilO
MSTLRQRWHDASETGKLTLVFLALALLGAGAYAAIPGSIRARVVALESRQAELRRALSEARAAMSELERPRAEMVEIEARLERLRQRLPLEREIPSLYRALYAAAAETSLAVGLFQPGEPRAREYYTEIPIAVTVHGTYHRLGRFLAGIAELSRVVTVESLKLIAIEHASLSLRAEMILTTYVYRPAVPPAVAAASPGTAPMRPR